MTSALDNCDNLQSESILTGVAHYAMSAPSCRQTRGAFFFRLHQSRSLLRPFVGRVMEAVIDSPNGAVDKSRTKSASFTDNQRRIAC